MPENEIIPNDDAPETAKEKFERERLSRRQALKRFGMTSAMATFALFSVDDLARMVGKAMQQRAGDNKVAALVAKEFQGVGIAMADGASGCGQSGSVSTCQHCANQMRLDACYCVFVYDVGGSNPNPSMFQHCKSQASYNLYGCEKCWCGGYPAPPPNNTCPPPGQTQPPQGCGC